MQDNDIKIAVLEEKIAGIREQQRVHAETTQKMFDKLFTKIDDQNICINQLNEALNRGKGAYAASLFFAGVIGGAFTFIVQLLTSLHFK